jgi:CDP-diacylglycerol--inositol 3-phosphatidyltransferase
MVAPRVASKSVWLYVPNLIGYVRVVCILAAAINGTDPGCTRAFFVLYATSYLLDAFDGPAARYLGETSRFGAVLDMVTDRVSTALLLGVLAHEAAAQGQHAYASYWLLLMMLDVGAHWVQTYSAGVVGAASHKELEDEPSLLTWYYKRTNLFVVCLLNETHLIMALLLARGGLEQSLPFFSWALPWRVPFVPELWGAHAAQSLAAWLWALGLPVFVLKQVISLVHLVRASQRVVALDTRTSLDSLAASPTATGSASKSRAASRKR